MTAEELITRAWADDQTKEYWFDLEKDMHAFLKGDYPETEKNKIKIIGPREMVSMICDGYRYEERQVKLNDK